MHNGIIVFPAFKNKEYVCVSCHELIYTAGYNKLVYLLRSSILNLPWVITVGTIKV